VLPEFQAYCRLMAGLPDRYPSIQSSTLTAYTVGPLTAEIAGEVTFAGDYVLHVWELLDLSKQVIFSYSYELDQAGERVWWYDPMDHPHDPTLRSTAPHHKHVAPDIKHNRVPAPEISFARPNLPTLIEQIEPYLKP
jgi:hypothetical protein